MAFKELRLEWLLMVLNNELRDSPGLKEFVLFKTDPVQSSVLYMVPQVPQE